MAARLGTDRALVVVFKGSGPAAFLIATSPGVPPAEAADVGLRSRPGFELALEVSRLGRAGTLHRGIQDVLLGFSRRISSTLSLSGALGALSAEMNALFGTARTSVWLHERRARELVLMASSDGAAPIGVRVSTESDATPARGLRLAQPEITTEPLQRVLIAPLRGWRRALGTLVLEGDPRGLDAQQFIAGTDTLARQLSVTIENVQLLEEFLQQRRLLEDTFNSLTDLVVVVDASLHVVQMNEVFATRVGREPVEILERPLSDFIGAEMASWVDSTESPPPGREPGVARTQQFKDERLGGIFAATLTPLINSEGGSIGRVLVGRDITAQTQLEIEREALSRRLAQSERLASLGQFVAGIAHEMNNPLQGVLGHVELLMHTSEAARPLRPTLRRIYQEGDRAAKIVRNLLVFAGSRRMKRVRLRVDRVLSRALASRAAALRHGGVEVTRSHGDSVPSVEGDALLLQQALLNVLTNAEDASKLAAGPPRIVTSVDASEDGLRVRVSIGDSGPGIQPDVLPHIFDPFFTTKDVGQGTGLGLAITYGIIQEHGGTIHAGNRPEGGAEFTIELPAAPAAMPRPERRRRRVTDAGRKPRER
jgi:signal transduction histidine kinase